MAFQMLKIASPIGSSKKDIVASAPVGTETITASVGAGEMVLIFEDSVTPADNLEVINAIEQLRDQLMENNK